MTKHTNIIIQSFDFAEAKHLSFDEIFTQSLESVHRLVRDNGYQDISGFPCVPTNGATDDELALLEFELGRSLPEEYRNFLSRCRYLKLDDGCEIGGFDHEGLSVTEHPWVSEDHTRSTPYLIFANYFRFADGDQLMFDLSNPEHPVIAYLHEHGPLFELYAPSFLLALWRLIHEYEDET